MDTASQRKPFIVPVFITHAGCPHRCLFCNQTITTEQDECFPTSAELQEKISQFLSYRRDADRWTEISFYGGTFLGLAPEKIQFLLDTAAEYVQRGDVQGIRFSTRPDTIDPTRLDLIRRYPVTTIEIGVQSMNDAVLANTRRGHTARDTHNAMALLREQPYKVGLQMMVGLPGDTPDRILDTGTQIAAMAPDFVRIYPLLVLKGSPLADWYAQGRYCPLDLDQSVELVKDLFIIFTKNRVPVIRMGLQPTAELNTEAGVVAGPFHPAFGELVHSAVWLAALRRKLLEESIQKGPLTIEMHSSLASRIKGQNKKNMDCIQTEFNLQKIHTRIDNSLPTDTIMVNGMSCRMLPAGIPPGKV